MWRTRGFRIVVSCALVATIALFVFDQLFVRIGGHALLAAPNAGLTVEQLKSPPPPSDVNDLRFDVHSPDASISTWLIDPPSAPHPTATIFVLHGIRSSKAALLGTGRQLAAAG